MSTKATAHGKIILSGEYAGVFGHRGIAIPSKEKVEVTFTEGSNALEVQSNQPELMDARCISYITKVAEMAGVIQGKLHIQSDLPIGKGMGSSTALVIAITKCFLGDDSEAKAHAIENAVNKGHSGLDFAVIWQNRPVIFSPGKPAEPFDLPEAMLKGMELIDTGRPDQTTPEMIAFVKSRGEEVREPLSVIANCTERILKSEDVKTVMRDHHKAQVMLGVVPEATQKIIADIEAKGGSAKVIGAGGRTGGGGMVLALVNS